MMDNNNNNHLDQNIHKDDDDDDYDKYAFPCNVVDLELPYPPMDASPMYITTATTTTNTGDAIDGKDDDGNEISKDTPPPVLYKVPTRFNYVTSNTTKVIMQRDVHGNDYSTTASNTNNDDDDGSTNGIGWFTNHRTIYVENGRINRYMLHTNGFELIPLLQNDDDNVSLRSSFPDPTTTISLTDIDFTNRNDVLQGYYPYCQQLLQQVLLERYGDQVQVWAFDHNVRIQPLTSSPPQQGEEVVETEPSTSQQDGTATSTKTTTVIQKPIGLVHGDYTTISAPRRLQLLSEPPKINDVYYEQFQMLSNSNNDEDNNTLDDRSDNKVQQNSLLDPNLVQECLSSSSSSSPPGDNTTSPRRRYAFINVWKNIDPHHPVMALPLGCVDATTVSMDDDLRTLELHYTDRIGENYLVCRPPISESPQHERREHHWVYYPQMTHNEVLLIKQWDSAGTDITSTNKNHKEEEYISTMAIHSAFIDPTTPPNNTIRRQSIEVRCVAIWV
jgi:hypothetical protein